MREKTLFITFIIFIALLLPGCSKKTTYTNEIEVEIQGIDRVYDYFLLNDMHLFIEDDEIKPEYSALVSSRINEFSLDGKTSSENFKTWISELDQKNLEGVILNADIMDQMSFANLSYVKGTLDTLSVPYMYLMSDHDIAYDWTNPDEDDTSMIYSMMEEMNLLNGYSVFEEDGFIILGINFSYQSINEDTLAGIKKEFEKKKPVIIVTHVPYDSQVSRDLANISRQYKGDKVLLWGTLNEDHYYPTAPMLKFLNLIKEEDSNVKAIVSAHLHAPFVTLFTDNIPEYIVGTGYSGVRTRLRITPSK